MRRLLIILFFAWLVLMATNSAVLVHEKNPLSLETISSQEELYLDSARVQIEGVGVLTIRQPVTDEELEQIIRRASQFTCTYFTGRKWVTKKYPQQPSPRNVSASSCPNVLWFENRGHADPGKATWTIMPAVDIPLDQMESQEDASGSLFETLSSAANQLFGSDSDEN